MGIAFAMMSGAMTYIASEKTKFCQESIILFTIGAFTYIACFTFYLIKEEK